MPTRDSAKASNSKRRAATRRDAPHLGLLSWAERVVLEADRAGETLEADPVHDLRVAIRRCRSIAEGLRGVDPVPEWKEFRGLAKPVFCALGGLRDVQVQQQWLSQLVPEPDALGARVAASLSTREAALKIAARQALADFNRKRWRKLARRLEARIRAVRPGSLVLQLLALERLQEALRLHERALQTRRAEDLHQLRIGIKHFRYAVENFLPDHHLLWKDDLKHAQDLLGDIHDLDVLRAEIADVPGVAASLRKSWNGRIEDARTSRLSEYLDMTAGGVWTKWRAGLPSGRRLTTAIQAKLRRWSAALDRDRAHSRRVGAVAVELWRELNKICHWPANRHAAQKLRIAAWLHGVGSAKAKEKRLEYLARKLERVPTPVGWTRRDILVVRLVARYGCGGLPDKSDRPFHALPRNAQRDVLRLAGVLRLADALDRATAGAAIRPCVEFRKDVLVIRAGGFDEFSRGAVEVAAARHLLELSEGAPVLVLPGGKPRRRPAINR